MVHIDSVNFSDRAQLHDRAVETTTYGAIAHAIRLAPAAARDVGAAVGRNPVSVIVACHRVIGSTRALVGFEAGLAWKRRLLGIENPGHWPWQESLSGIGQEPGPPQ